MNDLKSSSIKVTNHHNRSLPTALLQFIIHPFGGIISNPGKSLPAGSPKLKPHTSASRTCNIAEREIDGIWIYDLIAKEPQGDSETLKHALSPSPRIHFIAGDSFCMPPSSEHWAFCAELSGKLPRFTINLISPPLAPHSPAPVTFPRLVQLFKTLMASENDEIISFAGDSSGGNLVLSLVLRALKEDPTMRYPGSIMLISPVVDLRLTNPKIKDVESKDSVLRRNIEEKTAKSCADSWDLADPRLSQLLADVSILQ